MTPLQHFRDKWAGGCGSPHCDTARSVVLFRGTVPCSVLFIGEAPGISDDALGRPFEGPAGMELDRWIAQAWGDSKTDPTYAMANLVGCLPRGETGAKAGEPDHEQLMQCQPRLAEFIALCRPRVAVCVGRLSEIYAHKEPCRTALGLGGVEMVDIIHPAAVLRAPYAQRSMMARRAVLTITNAVRKLREGR